jgi:hypothetical protein
VRDALPALRAASGQCARPPRPARASALAEAFKIEPVAEEGHFPSEDAARKLIYLAIHNAVPQWTRTRGWTKALLAFKIHFGDRLPDAT